MARVTVEDCLQFVDNRFDLVLKASERARELALGAADPLVPRDNDKPTVIALREIAQGFNVTEKPSIEFEDEVDIDIFSDATDDFGLAVSDVSEKTEEKVAEDRIFGELFGQTEVVNEAADMSVGEEGSVEQIQEKPSGEQKESED